MADSLTPFEVSARRVLSDGSPDPCYDPANAGSAYCQTRQVNVSGTPETPSEWNRRQAAEAGFTVPVTQGVRSWLPLAVGAALLAALLYARK